MTGILTLAFFVVPFVVYLYIAWWTFCTGEIHSTFCAERIPNIYNFMQEKFWNVGFFRFFLHKNWLEIQNLGYVTIAMILLTLRRK